MDDSSSSTPGFTDPVRHHALYGETLKRICRIEVNQVSGYEIGTGILVAQDVVLTCYHVLRAVIEKEISPRNVIFRFEYQTQKDCPVTTTGKQFFLRSDDWLLDSSPNSPADQLPYRCTPKSYELDYALVRIVDYTGAPPDQGYTTLPRSGNPLPLNSRIIIIQHPEGNPLAQSTGKFLGFNENTTRLRHDANTSEGSSGAPCFDEQLNLVAIHRDFTKSTSPHKSAIPAYSITQQLKLRGKLKLLEDTPPKGLPLISDIEKRRIIENLIVNIIKPGASIGIIDLTNNDLQLIRQRICYYSDFPEMLRKNIEQTADFNMLIDELLKFPEKIKEKSFLYLLEECLRKPQENLGHQPVGALLIKVEERLINQTKYSASIYRWRNPLSLPIDNQQEIFSLIAEQQGNISLEEILRVVFKEIEKLVDITGTEDKVFVEFFLPDWLLNNGFYHLSLQVDDINRCLDKEYIVLVRANKLPQKDLERRWRKIRDCYNRRGKSKYKLQNLNGCCPPEFHTTLQECFDNFFGVVILNNLPDEQQCRIGLMKYIIRSRVPVILWRRDGKSFRGKLPDSMNDIPETIRKLRRVGKGLDLVLYWNDPTRSLPEIELESP